MSDFNLGCLEIMQGKMLGKEMERILEVDARHKWASNLAQSSSTIYPSFQT